ncbi:porin [Compostibacter hankyongensis]|uniref:Porin n=1 Tax=Compostibacter hankyongensis TaxID=1007089 RepID=A0ABP8FGP1_9BACT
MSLARILLLLLLCLSSARLCRAQFLMDAIDTSSAGKGALYLHKGKDMLQLSGYFQPQFQWSQSKGAKGYAGGDFPERVNNRFMLRRGRLRIDYERYNRDDMPVVQLAFQFDGTERGVAIRDFFGRFFENRWSLFSLTTGMFARPFGYEVNLSSSDRESPERGRMSQILMKTERDLGAMITFEPRRAGQPLRFLEVDAGLFNGQGLAGPADFDSHKDFIGRIRVKPQRLGRAGWMLSGGVSLLYGGMEQFTPVIYRTVPGKPVFRKDSSVSNTGRIAPRHYYGADLQLKIPNRSGATLLRAEYIRGIQTGTALSSETPPVIPEDDAGRYSPLYIRRFDGAYFYLLQNLGSEKHQLGLKYDWYDPNIRVKGREVGAASGYTGEADMRFDTFGGGYIYYVNEHLKLTLWYDRVLNEPTSVSGLGKDLADDVFTCRLQYRF